MSDLRLDDLERHIDRSQCVAVDLHHWGKDAKPGAENVGALAVLGFHCDPDWAISIDLTGSRGARRLLVNGEKLRSALAGAGVPWVKEPGEAP